MFRMIYNKKQYNVWKWYVTRCKHFRGPVLEIHINSFAHAKYKIQRRQHTLVSKSSWTSNDIVKGRHIPEKDCDISVLGSIEPEQ